MDQIEQEMAEIAEKLEKAMKTGEGSRGGRIVGHTRSGKPIYQVRGEAATKTAREKGDFSEKDDSKHTDYDLNDHIDAMAFHGTKRRAAGLDDWKERNRHDTAERYHDRKIGQMTNDYKFTDEHKKYGRESQAHYERQHERGKAEADHKAKGDELKAKRHETAIKRKAAFDKHFPNHEKSPEYHAAVGEHNAAHAAVEAHEAAGLQMNPNPEKAHDAPIVEGHTARGEPIHSPYGNVAQELNRKAAEMHAAGKISKKEHDAIVAENNKGSRMKKGYELILDTVMSMGPEALRKALPSLTEDQKALLHEVLAKAKKASSMDAEMPNGGPELIELASEKGKSKKRAGKDDEDLVREENSEVKHQGDETPEGKEGQLIKAKERGEIPNDEEEEREEIDELESEEPEGGKEKKVEPKKIVDRMKERGLKKADCLKVCESRGETELVKAIQENWEDEPLEKARAKDAVADEAEEEGESLEQETQEKADGPAKEAKDEKKAREMKAKSKGESDEEKTEAQANVEAKKNGKKANPSELKKSIPWGEGTARLLKASTRRGQNAHYAVEEALLKSEAEVKEILAKGGYLNDTPAEKLEKSQNTPALQKSVSAELIEKGLDMGEERFQRLSKLSKAPAPGKFTVSSFDELDLVKSLGMTEEKAAGILGMKPEELKKKAQ